MSLFSSKCLVDRIFLIIKISINLKKILSYDRKFDLSMNA